jgi:hypothetical protein
MGTALVFALAVSPAIDPFGPRRYTPTYIPAEAPFGYVYQPAFDVRAVPRPPAVPYSPKPGDVLLFSDTTPFWSLLFHLAWTGRPGHDGIVVRMPDGRLGVFESGYNDTPWSRFTPLDYRINQYAGYVWVRSRIEPLTPEQDRLLTDFAVMADGTRYAIGRYIGQLTPFRSRGPLRTRFLGKPVGPGHHYYCSQAAVEAFVYAGLIDAETARPGATFPQDLFYDRSRNLYIDRHPPLAGGWEAPRLWTPLPGTALLGKSRPHPPSPWPGVGGAYAVYPVPTDRKHPPTPVVVGYVPGELRPIATVEYPPQRIGFLDRPDRLLFRRRK